MPTLSNVMSIALTGLKANQQGLNITGHNIANVNTDGYTRQKLILESGKPVVINDSVFGTGVDVIQVARFRDAFLDRQFRDENQSLGNFSKQNEAVDLIEGILNEPGDTGLQNVVKNFFNSLQDLSNNPESSSVRTTVREQGRALASMFTQVWNQLDKIRDNKNFEILDDVNKANEILDRIADLNVQIGSTEALGRSANDLRDNRDRLLDELSKIVDVSANEDPLSGSTTVSISGQSFVVLDTVIHLQAQSESQQGKEVVKVYNPVNGELMDVRGGELRGLLDVRDKLIPNLQGDLDVLAKSLISEINAVHRAGFGLQGIRSAPPTGIDFFDGEDARTISLSDQISNDPGNIAASGTGAPGDNTNALALAQLRDKGVLNNGQFTFEDYYTGLVSTFGLETNTIQERLKNQEILVEHLGNFRESLIGVNLDEELVNLIRFQKAFGANARVISTTNELMDIVTQLGRY